jgi:hypothetical protein
MIGLMTSLGLSATVAAILIWTGRRVRPVPIPCSKADPVNVTVDDLFRLIGMKEAELAAVRSQLTATQSQMADLTAERDTLRAAIESGSAGGSESAGG